MQTLPQTPEMLSLKTDALPLLPRRPLRRRRAQRRHALLLRLPPRAAQVHLRRRAVSPRHQRITQAELPAPAAERAVVGVAAVLHLQAAADQGVHRPRPPPLLLLLRLRTQRLLAAPTDRTGGFVSGSASRGHFIFS